MRAPRRARSERAPIVIALARLRRAACGAGAGAGRAGAKAGAGARVDIKDIDSRLSALQDFLRKAKAMD